MNLRSAAVVYTAAVLHGLTVVSFPASASVLKGAGQLSDAQYGALFVPQTLATLVGSLIAAQLGPRAASRGALSVSLLCACAAEALLRLVPVTHSVALAMAATTATGLGFGLAAGPLNGMPGRLFPARAQAALVALHTLLAGGFAIGPLLVSYANSAGSWQRLPTGIALVCAAVAAVALVVPAPPLLAAREQTPNARAGSARTGMVFVAIAVLYALAEGTFANWAVVYLSEERAIAETWSALALAVFWSALALGRLTAAFLVQQLSAAAIWRVLPIVMALAFLSLPLVSGPISGVACFALAGFGCSAFFPLTVSLAAEHIPGGAARAGSWLTAALMVGVGLGSFAIGPLRGGASLATLYVLSAAYPVCAFGLCLGLSANRSAAATRDRLAARNEASKLA